MYIVCEVGNCLFFFSRLGILILSNMVLYHHLMSYRSPIPTHTDNSQQQYRYVLQLNINRTGKANILVQVSINISCFFPTECSFDFERMVLQISMLAFLATFSTHAWPIIYVYFCFLFLLPLSISSCLQSC